MARKGTEREQIGLSEASDIEEKERREKKVRKKKIRITTYTGVHILRCFVTGSRIPGAVDPATPSDESWEREPSRGERYT